MPEIRIKDLKKSLDVCRIAGCINAGDFECVIVVEDPRTSEIEKFPAMRAMIQGKICASHRNELTITAVLTDRMWSFLRQAYKGHNAGIEPNPQDVRLEFQLAGSSLAIPGKKLKRTQR
jgi:hypothetical protein